MQELNDFAGASRLDLYSTLAEGQILTEILRMPEISSSLGFAPEEPLYVLLVDVAGSSEIVFVPATHDPELVDEFLARAGTGSSAIASRHANGYAAISTSQAALDLVGEYALGDLLSEFVPQALTIVARTPAVMARYGAERPRQLAAAVIRASSGMLGEVEAQVLASFETVASGSRLIWVNIEPGAEHVSIQLTVEAALDSDLARFMRAQRPSDFARAQELAAGNELVLAAGGLQEVGSSLSMPGLLALFMPGLPEVYEESWRELITLSAGAGAVVLFRGEDDTLQLGLHSAVHDTARAREVLERLVSAPGGARNAAAQESRIGDVPVHLVHVRGSGPAQPRQRAGALPPLGKDIRVATAIADDGLWFLYGSDSEQNIERVLGGAMRGRGEHPAVTEARRRGESLVFYDDRAMFAARTRPSGQQGVAARPGTAGLGIGLGIGLGFRENFGWLRVSGSAELVRAMIAAEPAVAEPAVAEQSEPRGREAIHGSMTIAVELVWGNSEQTSEKSQSDGMPGQASCLAQGAGPGQIRLHLRREQARINLCYAKGLLEMPVRPETVVTRFQIGPQGNVLDVGARGVRDEVASCIADVIESIRFPSPCGGGRIRARFSIRFQPPESD